MPNESPTVTGAAELPIVGRREDIAAALAAHPLIIVAGDTGSGKSTQLPQFCLALGRGSHGLIAHTQPRRLAARALAARISDERGEALGVTVGYRVRFADQVSAATRLVLLTDGLLLAELTGDPLLRRYDTIIVDEAHERTLNIDLLLGVLKRLLPRRPDLKVIVTSATLDIERVARFFDDAPVIAVSGRGHPIEVRHAPEATQDAVADAEDPDLPSAVVSAYREIAESPGFGRADVLVFLPGEREIRDVGDSLERELGRDVEVLPLYSRLSWDQQRRIFQRGVRPRIVLATNVAETSITVPGIRAVIDSGLARISRYSPRSRLQRLPIEPVSRASADQRKGRCGRLGPGLCLRLYSAADFEARPAFTEPEVLRTNLAALLLRLAADGLGAAESFPFIDPPDSRALGDGYRVLQELEALDAERRITRRGRAMARLPLDPRLARALLESKRFRAEGEVLAIVAGLSVPDARIGTADGAADDPAASAVFEDSKSEFSALVKLWRAYRQARAGSRADLRRWCRERQLSVLRLSEWEDVYVQVADRAAELGITAQRKPASYTGVHRSLLAGFCTMVGTRGEDGVYSSTRGVHFHIFPGSPLKRRKPRWVMAANIVETSRVFARRVAEVEPIWIEAAARHLLKREFLEPDWSDAREEVVARERVSFLGLTLSANRTVNYGPIAPEEARLIFAREAIVYRRLQRRPAWLAANDAAIEAALRVEERLRLRDLVKPAEFFVEFYDQALPRQVSSSATLDYFSRHLDETQRAALTLQTTDIMVRSPDPALLDQFPEQVAIPLREGAAADAAALTRIAVSYRFTPGEPQDGVTLHIPLLALPQMTRAQVDTAIPGIVLPHVEALLRSLPKDARRSLIPIPATAAAFAAAPGGLSTDPRRLALWLAESRGIPESLIRFDPAAVPAHLVPHLAVTELVDEGSVRVLAHARDLALLRRRYASAARLQLQRHAAMMHPHPWRSFEAERLEESRVIDLGDSRIEVYPTLLRKGQEVTVGYEWSAAEAARGLAEALPYLTRRVLDRQARDLAKTLATDSRLMLAANPYLTSERLIDVVLHFSYRQACFGEAPPPRCRSDFEAAVERGRAELYAVFDATVTTISAWLSSARAVRILLDEVRFGPSRDAAEATRLHLTELLAADSLINLPIDWVRQLPRYIKGEERRWERLAARGAEASGIATEIDMWTARLRRLEQQMAAERRWIPQLDDLRGWLEEYRISLYAQELRTLGPVSAPRLEVRAAQIEGWLTR